MPSSRTFSDLLLLTLALLFSLFASLQLSLSAQELSPPVIKNLMPPAIAAGSPTFQLQVEGSGFFQSSVVRWNGAPLNTEFITLGRLEATVVADLVVQPGVAEITVLNPDEQVSNTVEFVIFEDLIITTAPELPRGFVGISYFARLNAEGGEPPYTWSLAGPFDMLPPGLTLDRTTGEVTGVPTLAGVFGFNVRVTDSLGTRVSRTFGIIVQQPLTIVTDSILPNAVVGAVYPTDLMAAGGVPPYTWEIIAGELPAGLNFNTSDGRIRGIPEFPGLFRFVAAVTDSEGTTAAKGFLVQIEQAPGEPPTLGVRPSRLLGAFAQGSEPAMQGLSLPNEGGGSLPFEVDFSTEAGGDWLMVSPLQGETTGANPQTLDVVLDPSVVGPGTYFGEIQIHTTSPDGGDSTVVPVVMAVSSRQQTLGVSHRGLRFTAVSEGPAPPPQRFRILNNGLGVLPWELDVTTISGGNWLGVNPLSSTTELLDPATVAVRVNVQGLAPGAYYGLLEIAAPEAAGSPKLVTVVLNLLPSDSNPGPIVDPTGMIFVARPGEDPPPPQELRIANLTNSPLSVVAQVWDLEGVQAPDNAVTEGIVPPGEPAVLNVQAATDGLEPGIHRRLITLLFDDEFRRNVDVLIVVPPQQVTELKPPAVSQDGCARTQVSPVFRVLGGTSPIPAGWPSSMEVEVVDDCGAAVEEGSVVADFAGITSPTVALGHAENGVWAATWNVPEVIAQSMASVTVTATDPGGVSGSLTEMVNVIPNPMPAPRVFSGGIVHGASFVKDPLGPGTIVSIFGENLSSEPVIGGQGAASLPLPTNLAGTQISLGGRPLPILFSRTDQVNAVLPFEVTDRLNENLPLLVRRTDAQSLAVSEPVFVTLARPGLFAQNAAGTGLGAIQNALDFQIVTDGNPVSPGDVIIIYATGLGGVTPGVATGTAAPASPLAHTAEDTTVTIGGQPAQVLFAGLAPGFASLYQVNAFVPQGVASGEVEVLVTIGGQTSPPVTLAVQ